MRFTVRHSKWFWVRVSIVVGGALSGPSITSPRYVESSNVAWVDLPVMFLFTIAGLLILLGIQVLNPRSARVWRRPSWEVNPFLLTEPLQFWHCAAYHLLAMGVIACITLVYRGAEGAPLAVSLLALGAGTRIAVTLSTFLFRRKMGKSGDALLNSAPNEQGASEFPQQCAGDFTCRHEVHALARDQNSIR
jgi:hypothetical protein